MNSNVSHLQTYIGGPIGGNAVSPMGRMPRPFPQEPGAAETTLYRMQPILNSPANGHFSNAHTHHPAPTLLHHHPAVDKAAAKTVRNAAKLRSIEHTIGDMIYQGRRRALEPEGLNTIHIDAGSARRVPLDRVNQPDSPVFGDDRGAGSAWGSPRDRSRSPGSPGRSMQEMAAEWQYHANDLQRRLSKHQSDINSNLANAGRIVNTDHGPPAQPYREERSPSPNRGPAYAPQSPGSPGSVVSANLSPPVDDTTQQQMTSALNAYREAHGAGGNVQYLPACKELAQAAAEELLQGVAAPSVETTQNGAQGQVYYVVQGKVDPTATLQRALDEWGAGQSPAHHQVVAASLLNVGFGFAESPGGCVLVVNLSPKA